LLALLWWGRQLPLLSQIRKDQLSPVTSLNAWGKGNLLSKICKTSVWLWESRVTNKLVYSFLQFGRYLSCWFMLFVTSKHLYKTCRVTSMICLKNKLFYLIKVVVLFVTSIQSSLVEANVCVVITCYMWSWLKMWKDLRSLMSMSNIS
jgi:hypothetical protein